VKRAKAPDDFSTAAKLILLVDVRGADDFRAKKAHGRPRLQVNHGWLIRLIGGDGAEAMLIASAQERSFGSLRMTTLP
jgi:hypothetical protein